MTAASGLAVALGRLRSAFWLWFCRALARAFYRRLEVENLERLPGYGPVLLCANHRNSVVDAILLQAACGRHLSPLARSGHFSSASMWPFLWLSRAIPVYRPQDEDSDTERNRGMFSACFERLAAGQAVLIFPEGESHSQPHLKPLKTGAARIALGTKGETGVAPLVLPASLVFTRVGKFRSSVLVQFGEPIAIDAVARKAIARDGTREPSQEAVRELTRSIHRGLTQITLSTESWEDLDFLNRLDRFYERRRGRRPGARALAQRFRALQRLVERYHQVRLVVPEKVEALRHQLNRFDRMCRMVGASDHRLNVRFRLWPVLGHVGARIGPALLVLPLALWGLLSSGPVYVITKRLAPRLIKTEDQLATAKVFLGMTLLVLLWGALVAAGYLRFGLTPALLVLLSLPIGAAAALLVLRIRARVVEELRSVLVLRNRQRTRQYLLHQRQDLEDRIVELLRISRRIEREDGLPLAS